MEGGGEISSEKTRIYVGGLGNGVTEDDLRKTFSALGEVVAVDVVRTKGRSFAYLDFLPSSDKSLPKLFSTYNGCMWKGGKLRLEKAKEHYLLRLKREWQEQSELSRKASDNCDSSASENHHMLEKPKKPSPTDKTQICMFFPKLGKVKSLAQVGIGKHKYSFQRIQVPSTPTHFCDCEEHSVAFSPPNKKQSSEVENVSYGINEQELNIMNSVMNKIFERANPSKQVTAKSESVNVGGVSLNSNELVAEENDAEDHLTDEEDNLIINVVTRNSDSMDLLGEMRAMMMTQGQEPVAKRPITSSEKPKSVRDSQKKTVPLSKKGKSLHSEVNDSSRTLIPETPRKIHLDTREDNKTKAESSTKQSGSNSLRSLKSTWKGLIGQKRNTSFNISDFLATVQQRKEEEIKGDDINQPLTKKNNLVHNKKRKTEGDKEELISSVPETTSSKSHINREATTEVDAVTTKTSISDVLANDCQQKEEEPKANNPDMPLTTTSQHISISDVHPDAFNKKEEDPKIDYLSNSNSKKLENADSQLGNSNDTEKPSDKDLIRTARGDFWRHKSSWTQLISTTNHTSFSISQIVPNTIFEKHEQEAVNTSDSQLPANKNLDDQKPVRKEVTLSPMKKNTSEKRKILSLGDLESEGTCAFMRTEESMKEWKKAKASLNSSLNKKKRSLEESG